MEDAPFDLLDALLTLQSSADGEERTVQLIFHAREEAEAAFEWLGEHGGDIISARPR